jgi:hypothetical protein
MKIERVINVNYEKKGELRIFKYTLYFNSRSRDSVVVIASSYGLDDRGVGVRIPIGSRIFSLQCSVSILKRDTVLKELFTYNISV